MGAVAGVTAAIGGAISIFGQEEEAANRQQAIRQQMLETRLQAAEKSLQRQNQLESVISTQRAIAGAAGRAPTDASFNAIQLDTFNQYASDERIDDLNTRLRIDQLASESQEAGEAGFIGSLGTLFGVASGMQKAGDFESYQLPQSLPSNFTGYNVLSRGKSPRSLFNFRQELNYNFLPLPTNMKVGSL